MRREPVQQTPFGLEVLEVNGSGAAGIFIDGAIGMRTLQQYGVEREINPLLGFRKLGVTASDE